MRSGFCCYLISSCLSIYSNRKICTNHQHFVGIFPSIYTDLSINTLIVHYIYKGIYGLNTLIDISLWIYRRANLKLFTIVISLICNLECLRLADLHVRVVRKVILIRYYNC